MPEHVVAYDGTRTHGHEPYELECRRCGGRLVPRTPIPVSKFVALAKAFGVLHKECSASDGGGGGSHESA